MLYFEINKSEAKLINEVSATFSDCKKVEVDSFGADTVIQLIIPVVAIIAPHIKDTVQNYLNNDKITVKYKGFEFTGSYKKMLDTLKKLEVDISE